MKTKALLLLGVLLVGCNPQTQATPASNGPTLAGNFPCQSLTYQPAGVLELDGSKYRLDGATGEYTFDGSKIVWTSGDLANQFGDSVYMESAGGKSIQLQAKADDPSINKVCKAE